MPLNIYQSPYILPLILFILPNKNNRHFLPKTKQYVVFRPFIFLSIDKRTTNDNKQIDIATISSVGFDCNSLNMKELASLQ